MTWSDAVWSKGVQTSTASSSRLCQTWECYTLAVQRASHFWWHFVLDSSRRLESRIVSLRCGLEMGCLPILDCEHVTFGGDSDTPSRLGIREQFFGLGHSVSLPLPQPVRV